MKKLFFLIAVLAVFAAAHFARPQNPKQSFSDYLSGKAQQGGDSNMMVEFTAPLAKTFAEKCTYDEHPFWVDAKVGDKAVYTNVFGRWISRAEAKEQFKNDVEKARTKVNQAADKLEGKQ